MQYTFRHAAQYGIVAARVALVRVLRLARVPWSWFEDFEEGTVLRAAARAFDFEPVVRLVGERDLPAHAGHLLRLARRRTLRRSWRPQPVVLALVPSDGER